MGNRVVITFDKKPTPDSLGIYLHWNGGPESVLAFAEAANKLGVRVDDAEYEFARIVQIIGNFFGGTTSLGVGKLSALDCDNGDNGVVRLHRSGSAGRIELLQSKGGKLGRGAWRKLDLAKLRQHRYWTGPHPILGQVLAANTAMVEKTA